MRKLWPDSLFSDLRRFKSITDVDLITSSRAWDPVVWWLNYVWFEKQARRDDPSGRNMWRDERLCGMRVLVASSTERFLSEDVDFGHGSVEQCVRRFDPSKVSQLEAPDPDFTSVERLDVIKAPVPRVQNTVRFDGISQPPATLRFEHGTQVRVLNIDCLDPVQQIQTVWPDARVACLNMANQFHPGGGWTRGRLAQEEMIFFRTAMSHSLVPSMYEPHGLGDFTSVYSHQVAVIRSDGKGGFGFRP